MRSEPSPIARRIRELRVSKKLSRQQLADKLKTSYLQIYRIEKGVTAVSAEDVPRFAGALDVPVTSLYRKTRAA